jgi:hypothetical protein
MEMSPTKRGRGVTQERAGKSREEQAGAGKSGQERARAGKSTLVAGCNGKNFRYEIIIQKNERINGKNFR